MTSGLRRDLGTLEAYAALLGILIGAGIFKVTGTAWSLTGPSVILGYLVLAPAVLATSVAYSVFLSTPLGLQPGGEYSHIAWTFGGHRVFSSSRAQRGISRGASMTEPRSATEDPSASLRSASGWTWSWLAFVGAWLKIISYIGALAYLAQALADYARAPLAIPSLLFFYVIHVAGVKWFGRLQVWMCALLGISILVLVVPGLFAIRPEYYRPFFTHGLSGFAASLPPLFFAYAGFESLAQAAGEVEDSTKRLPRIFIRGIVATLIIYLLMSIVGLGTLPPDQLRVSTAPMADAAAQYLPMGAAALVTLGAIMALTTSLNATMLVPSRIAVVLAQDGLAPRWLGSVSPRTGTPIVALTITFAVALILLVTNQIALALNIAVYALVLLYMLHSLALILLPRLNRELFQSATVSIPLWLQRSAAIISIVSMSLLLTQISLPTIGLLLFWSLIGIILYVIANRGTARRKENAEEAKLA